MLHARRAVLVWKQTALRSHNLAVHKPGLSTSRQNGGRELEDPLIATSKVNMEHHTIHPRRRPPPHPGLMTIALSAFTLLGTLVPCAHTFTGMLSLSHPTRSPSSPSASSPSQRRVHMFERSCAAPPIAIPLGGRPQRRARRVLMGSEEVGARGPEGCRVSRQVIQLV